jgi:outer membrane receptor protein involved in Fe transport
MWNNYVYMKVKNHILIVAFSAIMFCFHPAGAQTDNAIGEISGKVLDEGQKSFPYASVSLLNAKDSTLIKGSITADNGSFLINNIKEGNYLVAIYVVGYKKAFRGPFAITTAKRTYNTGSVQLAIDAQQLKGVDIVKQKPLVERQIDKTVINVENSALAAGNTALEILQKSPGVTVDKDGLISLKGKQGVTIMLDGKPTYLSPEQLANLLRSTEGNAIQSIELITNPSAKYDAAGNSGIINIKLKKNRNFGTNGSILAGGGYGRYYKANTGLNLNHREKKFNVFGNFDLGKNKRYGSTDIVRVNNTATNQTYFDQSSDAIRHRTNSNYKGGLDYFLNDNHTIGVAFNGYNAHGTNAADVLTLIGDQPGKTDSSVVAQNPSKYKYSGISYNLNYKGTLDTLGQEISVDADYSRYTGSDNNELNNRYLDASGQSYKPPYIFRNAAPTKTTILAGKVDYTYPMNKDMKLEFGAKASFVKTDNNYIFEDFKENSWVNNPLRSNQFLYDENINAAYANLNRKFKHTSVQLGLRAEQTNSKGNSITEAKIVNRHYLNLFPSVFVNQELTDKHDVGFSYSRRIDRPDYGSLNPFVDYLDLYTYRFGNPFLKPQYTNNFEFSYSFKKSLNVTLGYSHTSDVISDVLLTDTATKTIFISNQNLATQDSYNMNISYPLKITKWWSTTNNFTGFYNKFTTPDLLGSPFESGKLAFNANTNQTITLNKSTNFEWSGYYNSRQVYGTLIIAPQYSIDIGLNKSFWDKKLSLKLAANDVFRLQRAKITSALPSQNYVVRERWESRVFRLTCTYRFGSNEIKGARERSGSADAEGRRVKSGG